MKGSIDYIKIGESVVFNNIDYKVIDNTREYVLLRQVGEDCDNKLVKVFYYSCNYIKNKEGAYF